MKCRDFSRRTLGSGPAIDKDEDKTRSPYLLLSYTNSRVNTDKIIKISSKNKNVTDHGGESHSSMRRLHGLQIFKAHPLRRY